MYIIFFLDSQYFFPPYPIHIPDSPGLKHTELEPFSQERRDKKPQRFVSIRLHIPSGKLT